MWLEQTDQPQEVQTGALGRTRTGSQSHRPTRIFGRSFQTLGCSDLALTSRKFVCPIRINLMASPDDFGPRRVSMSNKIDLTELNLAFQILKMSLDFQVTNPLEGPLQRFVTLETWFDLIFDITSLDDACKHPELHTNLHYLSIYGHNAVIFVIFGP